MQPGQRFYKVNSPTREQIKADKKLQQMQKKYRQLVGSFIFICYTCRPDIMYATNVLCRAMSNPSYEQYEAAIYLLKYLAGTKGAGVKYYRYGNMYILIFGDSDDGSDESRKSCASHLLILAGGAIVWFSKLIKEYSLSSCESEIRALAAALPAIKTGIYVQKLIKESIESGIVGNSVSDETILKLSMPITILEDNKAVIDWAGKPTSTQRMRHVERSLYWIRQFVSNKTIKLEHIASEEQLADIGTKPLPVSTFKKLAQKIISYYV
jgi:hypothetical protein